MTDDPLAPYRARAQAAEDKFWARVGMGPNGCWVWLGSKSADGYGRFSMASFGLPPIGAHRFSWILHGGLIPDGLNMDHLCRNTSCVRPDHLEAVTPRENTLRGTSLIAENARKTECMRGHPLTAENVYMHSGTRKCRTCKALRRSKGRSKAPAGEEGP